ncbi:hypothetical protein Ae201684_009139 [Aphanomyces euteiches]|uniref:Uncharacterized protein n=1 Tax=Aphanomyces euteiches TaxID=100861 RepID=A0A6G0X2A2_9STRA|nr:hypothetical protein Ae201684_009139 [Aphanomyces euteiches]
MCVYIAELAVRSPEERQRVFDRGRKAFADAFDYKFSRRKEKKSAFHNSQNAFVMRYRCSQRSDTRDRLIRIRTV